MTTDFATDLTSDDDSALRFANLELGDATPIVAATMTVDVTDDFGDSSDSWMPKAAVPAKNIVPGVTIDQDNVARMLAQAAAARAAGFSLKPTVYQLGTSVNETGVENFKASRREFDESTLLGDGIAELINHVNDEKRTDFLVDLASLSMLDDGSLASNGTTYPLTTRALDGLVFFTCQSGSKYLQNCAPKLRAQNLNEWLPQAFTVDKRATNKAAKNETVDDVLAAEPLQDVYKAKRVTLRTRETAEGAREIYSVVGPNYGMYDFNMILERVYAHLSKTHTDARCQITYDGYKARIDVMFHSDIVPENAACGEIFRSGIIIKTSDDGTGAIEVSTLLVRNLCLNILILDFSKVLVGRKTHKGKAETIESKLDEVIGQAQEKISFFSQAWSAGNLEDVLERYSLGNPREVLENLVNNGVVHIAGVSSAEMTARLIRAWEKEPGHSKCSILNAITRAAKDEYWSSPEDVEELESLGAKLLFSKELNCKAAKELTVADVLG